MILDLEYLAVVSYLCGFFYSVIIGHIVIKGIHTLYYTGFYDETSVRQKWRVHVVGLVERSLYTCSWLAGAPEFVAIWLALKVANHWERWKHDRDYLQEETKSMTKDVARSVYSGYLLGNALSISFGLVGGLIVESMLQYHWGKVLLLAISLLLACGVLYIYIGREIKINGQFVKEKKALPRKRSI